MKDEILNIQQCISNGNLWAYKLSSRWSFRRIWSIKRDTASHQSHPARTSRRCSNNWWTGIGKTTVAIKVGHELVANSREYKTAVLFCSLRSKTKVIDVATSLILVCSRNLFNPPENPLHWILNWSKQQKQLRSYLRSGQCRRHSWVRRPKSLCERFKRHGKPAGHNVNFVITSRKILKKTSLKIIEVRLSSLSPEEAKKVIISQISDHDIPRLTKTETLVKLCGNLPLALCIVGSLLSDYTEDELISSLKKRPLAW